MAHSTDPVLDTLFLPFTERQLQWPAGQSLFLRARPGAWTHRHDASQVLVEQSFKPDADALMAQGYALQTDHTSQYPLVLVLTPRQRDEARALLARAVLATREGGHVVASVSNNEGARSTEADLEKLAGTVATLSKHKCRVFWAAINRTTVNHALLKEWLQLDAPRTISDARFTSRPGVFSWDRIDPASKLLVTHLPATLSGRAADLGAGIGYLAVELLSRCPGITALDLYEAEARALDLARHNLQAFQQRSKLGFHWHDVTQGLPQRYEVILSNPPFHTQSRADRPDIGRRFIAVAAAALAPGGQLWLVANRHLPYEETLNSSFGQVSIITEQDGFKIIRAIKQPATPATRQPRDHGAARRSTPRRVRPDRTAVE